MHEMILCKLGEVVLKGLNRRSFEDKLMSNVNRRVSKCGNFRVYSKQSTIYVEPKDDECDIEAAFESCKKVFGIIAVSKALPCEKDIQKIIDDAATEAVQEERQMTIDREAGYIETIKASGCEVNELTADEIAALTEVMKPVHEKYRDVIGSDTLDKAYEIIDKYNK